MFLLTRFGSTLLPTRLPSSDAGTGESLDSIAPLPDGNKFDYWGSGQVPRGDVPITHIGKIVGTSTGDAVAQFRALRALRGQRAKLYRTLQTEDGEAVEWCWARCLAIVATHERQNIRHQLVELQFKMLSPIWYGATHGYVWTFDDGEFFDDGLYFDPVADTTFPLTGTSTNITVPNDGNAIVRNPIITVTAAGSNITYLRITAADIDADLEFNGVIAVGQSLVIDCGAKSVKNNGVDAYDDFNLEVLHAAQGWMPLAPGDNDMTVQRTGGNSSSSINFRYNDGWE